MKFIDDMKLKKGDTVIVTTGKDAGKKGKIEKIFPKDQSVLIAGVNMFKRHMKKRDEKTPAGIMDFPRPLAVSKVALVCPACGKPTRVGHVVTAKEKERICRKCGQKV